MSARNLLLPADTRLTCPKCEHEFSLEDGFARQALESMEAGSASSLAELRRQERALGEQRAAQAAGDNLRAMQQKLAASEQQLQDIARREAELQRERQAMAAQVESAAAARAVELAAAERGALQKQLDEKNAQVAQLRNEQLALREQRQQLQDEKAALQLEVRKQVDALVAERERVVRGQEQERATLERAELQKKLDDARAELEETRNKLAQGSQQLQGEVLELAIEEGLARAFPLDTIAEVKKGVRGGDVIQRVVARSGQAAGVILWESKRAKDYSAQWLVKLKDDMRAASADMGVLVTMPSAVPKDWPSGQLFALVDGVYVVVWSVALQLAEVLRTALLEVSRQRQFSAGRNEKAEAIYDYVTSPQFGQKLQAVYETFGRMREELESEKNQAMQRWARREKQLQAGMSSLLGIGGEIQGLASQELKMLEMEPPPGA